MHLRATFVALALLLAPALVSAAPKGREPDDGEKTHVVAPGQTLAKIAKRYRVTPQDLREANDLSPGAQLKPGTRLVIPSDDLPADRSPKKHGKAHPDKKDDKKDEKADKKGKKDDDRKGSKAGQDKDDRDAEDDPPHRKGDKKGKKDKDKDKDKDDKDDDKKSSTVEPGHVRLVRGDKSWEGKVLLGKGAKVTPASTKAFSQFLAPEGVKAHPIDAKLIALLAKVSDHFGGRPIEVVSGFRPRSPKQHTPNSKHNSGSAVDFHIPGVRNEELRDYARSLGKVGVGYYPNSGFIHLDVRPTAFSWTDTSRAGESPRYLHDEPKEGEEGETKKKKHNDS